jgi:YD repeat-containing protein
LKRQCYDLVSVARKRTTPAPKAKGSLLLDEQLCFALYAASRAVTQRYRPLLEKLGLTYPQYLVMLVLWEQRATTVKELADQLQLDYGTLSPLLKRLAAAGFVERQRRNEDERSVEITLTQRGKTLERKAADIPQLIVDAYKLDAHEFASLRNGLRDLAESVTGKDVEA